MQTVLDAILAGQNAPAKKRAATVLDSAEAGGSAAASFAAADIGMRTVSALHQWVETDDLEDGESHGDRLLALMVGIANEDQDGELSDDEQDVLNIALNSAWDYLTGKGVAEEDADALLSDFSADVAERVRELLASSLPDGDAADSEIDAFAFGDDDQGAVFDAVYKKAFAIRAGKKVRINKRVSGTVRLSARQKLALAKARRKAFSAGAVARRMRSMRMSRRIAK